MKAIFALLSSFVLLASFAQAQKEHALPKELPPYGPVAPLKAPTVKTVQLENGLTVWLVAREGFPKVAVTLAVRGGLSADPKERPGLAELLAKSLTQGTKTRTARQVAEQFQAAGGDLSARAAQDSIYLSTSVLADKFSQVLPVLADVATGASFPDAEVKIAKNNVSNSLRSREAEPGFLAGRALAKIMFGDHPYSVIAPTQPSIEQTTPEELRREFARRFQPKQAVLVVVGSFDAVQAETSLRQAFQSWKPQGSDSVAGTPKPAINPARAIFLVPREGSVQTTLRTGAPGPLRQADDYEAAELANTIYGGMFGSRLVLNIREDKGYTYSPFAALRTYREAGFFFTQADVRNAVTGATLNEIDYELNRMTTTSPSDTEMTQAKRYLVGNEALGLQSGSGLAGELASLWVDGLPPDNIAKESERIEKSTATDVTIAARKYLPPSHAAIIAVGEEKVVKEELKPFGLEIKPAP
ncbi:MAG TPA: pitrilysin family protein [Terriglobales bacterium]|nr:pitrilysin family protein [Terriglobales bacterium]